MIEINRQILTSKLKRHNHDHFTTTVRYIVYAVDKWKAVDFHYDIDDNPEFESYRLENPLLDGQRIYCAGIEIHSREQLYDFDSEPIDNCSIMCGPCFTDGTSLGASELLEVMGRKTDEEYIWMKLESRLLDYFKEDEDE